MTLGRGGGVGFWGKMSGKPSWRTPPSQAVRKEEE